MIQSLASGGARYSLKTRLYSIIAFLGLLPVVGVALALVAVELSRRDDAALDRVARGTINLERVNGLVYAVVMESRGIYMSADWTAAEPFAKNLSRQLGELQDVARVWRADAIASQQSNIEDLAERIDQFVRFRTELVRLGKEESTAAARAFGDMTQTAPSGLCSTTVCIRSPTRTSTKSRERAVRSRRTNTTFWRSCWLSPCSAPWRWPAACYSSRPGF
jgi:hypothetical protein